MNPRDFRWFTATANVKSDPQRLKRRPPRTLLCVSSRIFRCYVGQLSLLQAFVTPVNGTERTLNGLVSFVAVTSYLAVSFGQGERLAFNEGRVFRILYSWVHFFTRRELPLCRRDRISSLKTA